MAKFISRPPPTEISNQQSQIMTNATNATPQPTYVERIMVGLDHAPPAFDLRGQLIGSGGANLHYIRNETGAIATLRGRGSLFVDLQLGTESPEPMHLYIEHPRQDGLQSAKQLAKNLIETLQQELVHFQQLHPPVVAATSGGGGGAVQYGPSSLPQQQQIHIINGNLYLNLTFLNKRNLFVSN